MPAIQVSSDKVYLECCPAIRPLTLQQLKPLVPKLEERTVDSAAQDLALAGCRSCALALTAVMCWSVLLVRAFQLAVVHCWAVSQLVVTDG